MKKDEILYVAYKNMLLANLKSGFLGQHISDSDFYAFDEHPNLFVDIIDECKKKHGSNKMIEKFYTLNHNRLNDIPLAKKLFENLVCEEDFKYMIKNFGEDVFVKDLELMKKVIKNNGGTIFDDYFPFKTIRSNNELRENIYDLNDFSLTWFDLPAPKDDELIKEILIKDPKSYSKLSEEQKNNKEYLLIAFNNATKGGSSSIKNIYNFVPEKLKEEEDISLLAAKGGCIEQPLKSFNYNNIFLSFLNATYQNNTGIKKIYIDLNIPIVNYNLFRNKKNIEDFFNFLTINKEEIKTDYETYSNLNKILKEISKIDPYVKEQINNEKWNKGNLKEIKKENRMFFNKYFTQTIPEMFNEIKYYVMAEELSSNLDNNNEKEKRLKI